jgi:phosphoadenosine phosphosulfate reductase
LSISSTDTVKKPHPEGWRDRLGGLTPAEGIRRLCEAFPEGVVFSTSFGMEDQLLTHWIATEGLPVRIFTLDTGRLFPETYATWSATLEAYGITIEACHPSEASLGDFVSRHGPNAFYQSIELRKDCCRIRKVEPLREALQGAAVWITGIRAGQGSGREGMPMVEWDGAHGLYKFHPLLAWDDHAVREEVRRLEVPYNSLHDRGFLSIGCAPCTRAVRPGEDVRAGRWWWEQGGGKECGLHAHGEPHAK